MAEAFIVGLAKRKPGRMRDKAKGDSKVKPEAEEEETDGDGYDEVEESALDDMIDALGIDEDKADAFRSALSEYVDSCVQRHVESEHAESEE